MTDTSLQAQYDALLEVVEEQCETDAEFTALMARVPAGSLEERWDALALLACDVIPALGKGDAVSASLAREIVAEVRRAVVGASRRFPGLARLLARADKYAARRVALEARRSAEVGEAYEVESGAIPPKVLAEIEAALVPSWFSATADGMRWMSMGSDIAVVRRDDRILGLVVQRPTPTGKWHVMAIETTMQAGKSMESFFDNHAHAMIGDHEDLDEAKRMAAAYAAKWLAGEVDHAACACGEVALPATGAVTSPRAVEP